MSRVGQRKLTCKDMHMRRRRTLLAILIIVAGASVYHLASPIFASAKLVGYGGAFDFWRGPVSRSTIQIGAIPTDLYTSRRSVFPVVLVHGVNETGKDSPDAMLVAEVLAGSGYRVFVPQFVRLTQQHVTPEDVDDVLSIFKSIGSEGGIICASYGCGPALIAAARPEIRESVRFVVTFGAYFDATETLRFIVTGPPTPLAYSRWVYMAGNVDLLNDETDRMSLSAIANERDHLTPEEWTLAGEDLGPEGRAMLAVYESQTPKKFDERLDAVPRLRDRLSELSPSNYLEGIRARLIIVHMASDPSIPSSESIRMAETAKARQIPFSLTILNMYGHTRLQWPEMTFKNVFGVYLPESWKFMGVVKEVLGYARPS
jgi:acetyl esterase/lipase